MIQGVDLSVMLAAAIGLCVVLLGAYIISQRPVFGIPLVLGVTLMTAAGVSFRFGLGAISIYQQDVALVIIALATILRALAGHRVNRLILPLLAILMVNYLLGVGRYGLQTATTESREYFYFLVTAAFFTTARVDRRFVERLRNWWVAASGYLAVVAVVFVARYGFGAYGVTGDRPLNNIQAFVVLEATVMVMLVPFRGSRLLRLGLPMAGFLLLVISSQRTVWAAAAVAVIAITGPWNSSSENRVTRQARWLTLAISGALAMVLFFGPTSITKSASTALTSAGASDGTLAWRQEGWGELISKQFTRPLSQVAFGNPSGTGYSRTGLAGGIVSVVPHNMYVASLLIFGIVGLVVLVALYASAFRRVARLSKSRLEGSIRQMLDALLAAQLVFFFGYGSYMTMGVVLGICLSASLTGHIAGGPTRTDWSAGDSQQVTDPLRRSPGKRPVQSGFVP